ncbi:30S ribosomal protein S13 [Candidatus Micrarchaeota archaeon]|nr:30S ribosomal protein S13 [Candidatus Micrarchaeota archaeon]
MAKAKKKDKDNKDTKTKEKPKKEKESSKRPQARPHDKEEEGVRGIVRLAGKDVRGNLPLSRALMSVKGIGQSIRKVVAKAIAKELKIDSEVKVGTFTDEQIEKIDAILANLQKYDLPAYLLNRRKDTETGNDVHNIMNDLVFAQRQDVENEKKLYTWRGYRHAYGQKTRGQRTKNTGRKGMSLGVIRKAQAPASGGSKDKGKK